MYSKFILLSFLLVTAITPLRMSGQDIDLTDLVESEEESDDQTELIEYLQELLQHPIDLNKTTVKQLETLPWISPTLSRKIIDYRNKCGKISHIEDLLSIPELTPDIFQRIRPFLAIRQEAKTPFQLTGRQRVFLPDADKQHDNFIGGKEKTYNRIDGVWGQSIQLGLLAEKDSGEKPWNDLQSGYMKIGIGKPLVNILLGNFIAEFGQGLVFWGPYRLHKGYDAIAPVKARGRGLRPYRSVDENASLFGAATSVTTRFFTLDVFYSQNKRDAITFQDTVRSLIDTGYHRTSKELSHQDALGEMLIGMNLTFPIRGVGQIGFTHQVWAFDKILVNRIGDFTTFSGRRNMITSVNWDVTLGAINFFGEAAHSRSGEEAFMAGCWLDMTKFSATLAWRRFDRDYFNYHGYGFGNRGDVLNNEKGFYLGWRLGLWRGSKISFYLDNTSYPWPKHTVPMPSSERQVVGMIEQKIGGNIRLQMSVKSCLSERSESIEDQWGNPLKRMINSSRSSYRGQMIIRFNENFRLKTRVEWHTADTDPLSFHVDATNDTCGVLFYQDVNYRLTPTVRFITRWTFFDAPIYDVRFYQYENDLPGIMRLKMLYGRGTRWYLMTCFHLFHSIKLYLKYEHTWYDRVPQQSGSVYVGDKHTNAFSAQLDWEF